jgi:hypothetical protein
MGIFGGEKFTEAAIWLDTDAPLARVQPVVFGQTFGGRDTTWGEPTAGFGLAVDLMRPRSAGLQLAPEIDVQALGTGTCGTRKSEVPQGIWNVRLYEDQGSCSFSMRWHEYPGWKVKKESIDSFFHSAIALLHNAGVRATSGPAPDKYLT